MNRARLRAQTPCPMALNLLCFAVEEFYDAGRNQPTDSIVREADGRSLRAGRVRRMGDRFADSASGAHSFLQRSAERCVPEELRRRSRHAAGGAVENEIR